MILPDMPDYSPDLCVCNVVSLCLEHGDDLRGLDSMTLTNTVAKSLDHAREQLIEFVWREISFHDFY